MRLIDGDALIMALRIEYPMMPMFKENRKEWEIKTDGYRKAEQVIRNAPTIDIVGCNECKCCIYEAEDDMYYCDKLRFHMYINCHHCSFGERKGE